MGQNPAFGDQIFMSMQTFLAMGGYAFYVWSAYGLTFLVLLANLIIPIMQRRTLLKTLARKQKQQQS